MNLPNKLTLFRILIIPVIMIVYSVTTWRNTMVIDGLYHLSLTNFVILLLAGVAMFTDLLDGKIARKHNLVTDLGKFLDPLADKLLVTTLLMILLDECNYYNFQYRYVSGAGQTLPSLLEWWMVVIILAREFIVTGIRLVAAGKKQVIAASWYGKIKTNLQFFTIIYLLLGVAVVSKKIIPYSTAYVIIGKIMIYFMMVATIFSGYDYVKKSWYLLKDENVKKKTKKELNKTK